MIPPVFHQSYEGKCWVCFYHAEASINAAEVQTQKEVDEEATTTPKAKKSTKSAPNPTAPVKTRGSKASRSTGSRASTKVEG